jgi:peptidoglycan/LPS O-acetylase OafA/YrhL
MIETMDLESFVRPRYRPDIDGLRAVAVTLVILVHAFPERMKNGFVGVDVFFVISGFLITSILTGQMHEGVFSLRNFYVHRINRIFPALVLVLAVTLAFGWLALYPDEYKLLGRSAAAGAAFSANVNAYAEGGYWDVDAKLKPLLHLWSLGVEEQFYLIWPVLLLFFYGTRVGSSTVLIVFLVASLGWNLWSVNFNQPAAFFLPFSRFWELLVGGTLAYLGTGRLCKVANNICAFVGAGALAAVLIEPFESSKFPGWHVLLPVFGAALIIGAGPNVWLNRRVLSNRAVVYIGAISYPLYLWHWPLLSYGHILENGEIPAPVRSGLIVATVMLAIATYHLVEKKIPRRAGGPAIVLTVMLALLGTMGFIIMRREGIAARYPSSPHVANLARASTTSKVALIGDSNAGMYIRSLSSVYGENLKVFSTPGWPYLAGVTFRPGLVRDPSQVGTPEMTTKALAEIVADKRIDVVIIANMYVLYIDSDQARSVAAVPGETGAMAYEAGLRRTAEMLTAAGKKVIYLTTIPFRGDIGGSVLPCSSSRLPIPRKRPPQCDRPLAQVKASRAVYEELVKRALNELPGVTIIDTMPYFCDEQACHIERDGIMLYADYAHLSEDASRRVILEVSRRIEHLTAEKQSAR